MSNYTQNRRKNQNFSIIGIDEAGRGALSGPVVASSVRFLGEIELPTLKDSKKMTPLRREKVFEEVKNNPLVEWGIGVVSERVIEKINILEATKLAMLISLQEMSTDKSFVIVDGNFALNGSFLQISLPQADSRVRECSLASVIAKVKRDEMMRKLHKKYPLYGFEAHKGYGTKVHFNAIEKHGICSIHRKTFYPCSKYSLDGKKHR